MSPIGIFYHVYAQMSILFFLMNWALFLKSSNNLKGFELKQLIP
jgi:hypothetical protein